jgi:Cu/Ag efflux pump CusA
VAREVERRVGQVDFPHGYHAEVLGEYQERQAAQHRLLVYAVAALAGILLLLQTAFRRWRLAWLAILTLPMALAGGILATAAPAAWSRSARWSACSRCSGSPPATGS